jgi:hypothetical protein
MLNDPNGFFKFLRRCGKNFIVVKESIEGRMINKGSHVENNYIESCCQIQAHYNQFQGVPINVL